MERGVLRAAGVACGSQWDDETRTRTLPPCLVDDGLSSVPRPGRAWPFRLGFAPPVASCTLRRSWSDAALVGGLRVPGLTREGSDVPGNIYRSCLAVPCFRFPSS